jgi:hypothetical protein
LTDFLGSLGFFAITGIWDESGRHKRAKARPASHGGTPPVQTIPHARSIPPAG